MTQRSRGCILVALDGMAPPEALGLAKALAPHVAGFKIHSLLDGAVAPSEIIRALRGLGGIVFVDAKFHDTPSTVALRVGAYAAHGAHFVSVHASGRSAMVRAAVEAYDENRQDGGLGVLAVTVLTSLSAVDCLATYGGNHLSVTEAFVRDAEQEGVAGHVCSAYALPSIRADYPDATLVVPGVRINTPNAGDHAHVDTPANVVRNGADYLVVGQEVTTARDPLATLMRLYEHVLEKKE